MYYSVIIKSEHYDKIEFKFGSWKCAQSFIDEALIYGDCNKISIEVKLVIDDDCTDDNNLKED